MRKHRTKHQLTAWCQRRFTGAKATCHHKPPAKPASRKFRRISHEKRACVHRTTSPYRKAELPPLSRRFLSQQPGSPLAQVRYSWILVSRSTVKSTGGPAQLKSSRTSPDVARQASPFLKVKIAVF